ncbi:MAG: DUF1553 domain-containing protein [bacterium]
MYTNRYLYCVLLLSILYSCSPSLPDDVAAAYKELPDEVDYNVDVKPILSDKCFSCHGPDKNKQKAGLRLDIASFAYAELPENKGKVAIDPGNLKKSEMFHRILSSDPEYIMPTPESHLSLSAKEKAILIKWLEDGAEYKPHWAYTKPQKVKPPKVKADEKVANPIDNFILSKLEKEGLTLSTPADKELLLRRLSLDLTGLPPTIQEIDAFLRDNSKDAFEKQVERLLASPHFGEKMAVEWLDLARFADSYGYTVDRLRDMSPYRDWVINAFNKNLPYSTFIEWQIAGDMFPKPSKEMIIATAFNRNHQQNMEGGIIEEEFQTEYVIDRTNTFGQAFLATSIECSRCHDHKYDPFSQKEYFSMFSFFNNVKEAGQISWDDATPTPALQLPTEAQERTIKFIQAAVVEQEKKVSAEISNDDAEATALINAGSYKTLEKQSISSAGLQGQFDFDKATLKNKIDNQLAVLKQDYGIVKAPPAYVNTPDGKGVKLDGDTWIDLQKIGIFRKSEPFSVGIKVNIPSSLKEGVIFHKSLVERLYNFRGYHLLLTKDNKLELSITHTAPSNAIAKLSIDTVPRDKWIQLAVTYDGSSRASGMKLFMDGAEVKSEIVMDQLMKDILFNLKDYGHGANSEPGLQIGAWSRGAGLKGASVDDVVVYDRELTPFEVGLLSGKNSWSTLATKKPADLTDADRALLRLYYLSAVSESVRAEKEALKKIRTMLSDSTESIKEISVMQEMKKPKKTHVLIRGQYNNFGEQVFPKTPESILPFPNDLPKNRFGLAKWLTHPDNPLTARVAVNRMWQNFFGTGLVKTTEDFGSQGEVPVNQALLDWLSVKFIESNWNVKDLVRMIVSSATYRQDSRATPEAIAKDPENRLLSHAPAVRLTAEMIRDNALKASGLINTEVGGPSIKPYQPEGLWEINNTSYTPDTGKIIYKRSLYVVVKRSVPNPTLSTFDATSRSYCVVRRQPTNTPLQALVTLNDPTFVEASRVLGEQISKEKDLRQGIIKAYRKLTGRKPQPSEVDLLIKLQKSQFDTFEKYPFRSKGWLATGQYVADINIPVATLAANTVVANTILNSDACLTKR